MNNRMRELEEKLYEDRNSLTGGWFKEYLTLEYERAKESLVTCPPQDVDIFRGKALQLRSLLKIISDRT